MQPTWVCYLICPHEPVEVIPLAKPAVSRSLSLVVQTERRKSKQCLTLKKRKLSWKTKTNRIGATHTLDVKLLALPASLHVPPTSAVEGPQVWGGEMSLHSTRDLGVQK